MRISHFWTRLGKKLNESYPKHIQNWASRLQSSFETNELDDLKDKYKDAPLRRPANKAKAQPKTKKKPKKRS
jgi:hypothetical protein